MKCIYIAFSLAVACFAQRSPYAGRNAIGYPQITTSSTAATSAAEDNTLGQRIGSTTPQTPTTTIRMPIEANGDRNLLNRLSQLPLDHQPFWLINWQALEEQRSNPRSYTMGRNHFVDFSSWQNRNGR